MAADRNSGGQQSPTANTRNEKIFEDAQYTGVINLSGKKLKEFPRCSKKYDLSDTVAADLSKNRFSDIPTEVCNYESLEQLNLYHNVMKALPVALSQLQALVQLNLGRNQLTVLPPFLCSLPCLEVLQVSNNKLVSLPEEIAGLEKLMELDVSCNEITHLPSQIGDLQSLRQLSVRRNLLVELPNSITRLKLHKLDFSCNKISEIPCDIHQMESLQEMQLEHNPLTCPPAHLCTKGLVHIKKYLFIQALKEDRKRGLMSDVQLRKNFRKSGTGLNLRKPEEYRYSGSPRDRRKHHTVDSGYSTTDSNEKMRWSPSETHNGDLEEVNNLALRAAESAKVQRHGRELARRTYHDAEPSTHSPVQTLSSPSTQEPAAKPAPVPRSESSPLAPLSSKAQKPKAPDEALAIKTPNDTVMSPLASAGVLSPKGSVSSPATPNSSGQIDEFTRELMRQKSEYEARKKRAEQLRLEREREEERAREEQRAREEKQQAALRLQEEQKPLVDSSGQESMTNSLSSTSFSVVSSSSESRDSSQVSRASRIPQSNSFREERKSFQNVPYRRTVSDSNYNIRVLSAASTPLEPVPNSEAEELPSENNVHVNHSSPNTSSPPSSAGSTHPEQPRVHYIPVIHDTSSSSLQEDEFRRRHEAMLNQQRHEAQMIQQRLEEKKQHILRMQKELVIKWSAGPVTDTTKVGETNEYNSFNKDGTPTSSFNGSALNNHKSGLPPRCQKVLEALGPELNNMNPAFTIRRNLQHAQEEIELIDKLRKTIESRLKVTLPDNLPAALKDGVVLCHLANHIRPRSVSSIHVPSPTVPKLPLAKCRRNVENFLEACRRIGVQQDQLFVPLDVLEERGLINVAYTIQALVDRVRDTKQSAV